MIKRTESRTRIVSALTARTQFGQIMRRAAENGERFLVGRRGEPAVVIMSVQDYMDTFAPAPDWLERAWARSAQRGTDKLSPRAITREIAATRRERRSEGEPRPKRRRQGAK